MAKKPAPSATPTSLVLRTCRADLTSSNSFQWPGVGEEASAPDWRKDANCGHGLHGWLYGQGDHDCSSFLDADSKWLVVEVVSDEIVMLGGKCKFPRGTVRFVGDRVDATDYLLAHEPRAAACSVIGANRTVGDNQPVDVGALGCATAGTRGTATAGTRGTATAGTRGTATAGYCGTATAGHCGTATAGTCGTATAGYCGTATAGTCGTATAGDSGTATAGTRGTATAGTRGTATAGDSGTATVGTRGTATAGDSGTATAGYCGTLILKWWDDTQSRYRTVIAEVGENGIEANVPYKLNAAHQFVKVKP
jgi:hypothetical protein